MIEGQPATGQHLAKTLGSFLCLALAAMLVSSPWPRTADGPGGMAAREPAPKRARGGAPDADRPAATEPSRPALAASAPPPGLDRMAEAMREQNRLLEDVLQTLRAAVQELRTSRERSRPGALWLADDDPGGPPPRAAAPSRRRVTLAPRDVPRPAPKASVAPFVGAPPEEEEDEQEEDDPAVSPAPARDPGPPPEPAQ